MAKAFIENKINGAVLMCLNENHMKEMGCAVLGEEWVGQGRAGEDVTGGLALKLFAGADPGVGLWGYNPLFHESSLSLMIVF